jgi:hypothetical protein
MNEVVRVPAKPACAYYLQEHTSQMQLREVRKLEMYLTSEFLSHKIDHKALSVLEGVVHALSHI